MKLCDCDTRPAPTESAEAESDNDCGVVLIGSSFQTSDVKVLILHQFNTTGVFAYKLKRGVPARVLQPRHEKHQTDHCISVPEHRSCVCARRKGELRHHNTSILGFTASTVLIHPQVSAFA